MVARRTVLTGAAAAGLLGAAAARAADPRALYGLIGKFTAKPGQRLALAAAILESGAMPGCLSYVVAEDTTAPDDLWVTEVWESKADQEAFMASRLGAALGEVGVPAPSQIIESELVNYQTP